MCRPLFLFSFQGAVASTLDLKALEVKAGDAQ